MGPIPVPGSSTLKRTGGVITCGKTESLLKEKIGESHTPSFLWKSWKADIFGTLVALHTEERCVEYKADLGRLHTCYLGAKKSRNLSLKQRFAVGLRSCQLKADHGLLKDSRDKITGRHTKNVACPEFLRRVTTVPQSQLWVERAGLHVQQILVFSLQSSIPGKRRAVWDNLVPGAEGQAASLD